MYMLYIYWIIKVSLYLVSGLIEDTQINNLFSGRNTKFPPPPVRPYSGSCFLDFFHPFFLYKYHIFDQFTDIGREIVKRALFKKI